MLNKFSQTSVMFFCFSFWNVPVSLPCPARPRSRWGRPASEAAGDGLPQKPLGTPWSFPRSSALSSLSCVRYNKLNVFILWRHHLLIKRNEVEVFRSCFRLYLSYAFISSNFAKRFKQTTYLKRSLFLGFHLLY